MPHIEISIIFGFRNRDHQRVKRCLDSLKQQSYKNFEIVFIDYGSDPEFREVASLVKSYPSSVYVYSHTQGLSWNRSHALNSGVRIAKGKYVLFGDVDLIYGPQVLESLIKNIDENSQLHGYAYLLPKKFKDWNNLITYRPGKFRKTDQNSKGACHFIEKSHLMKIRGYDEYYCFWGIEDLDLSARLEKVGLNTKWIPPDDAPMYHQWHPLVNIEKVGLFPSRWWDDMNIHFQQNIDTPVRNDENWGKILQENDRPIFGTSEQIELKVAPIGDPFVKLKIIGEVLESINKLQPHQCLKIHLTHNSIYKAKGTGLLLKVFHKLLKETFGLRLMTISNYQLLMSAANDQKFFAERDIYYLIWQLIKKGREIRDYSINNRKDTTEILLCK